MQQQVTLAARIAGQVIDELFSDRRGLKHEWEQIDEDTKDEIQTAVILRIARELKKANSE